MPVKFTEQEVTYLNEQPLARIATASDKAQPDVAPVGFDFDGDYFYVGGLNLSVTYKYKNVQTNGNVAFVVDDLESTDPWRPRGLKVHGTADLVERENGYLGAGVYIRILPERKWSWGIDKPRFE